VELEELQIADGGAHPHGGGDAVAGRDGRVRRMRVQLPRSTRREHDGIGRDALVPLVVDEQVDPGDAAVLHDEVHEEGVLDDADGALAQAGDESLSITVPVASPPACRMRG
jgi:hypothetical protein